MQTEQSMRSKSARSIPFRPLLQVPALHSCPEFPDNGPLAIKREKVTETLKFQPLRFPLSGFKTVNKVNQLLLFIVFFTAVETQLGHKAWLSIRAAFSNDDFPGKAVWAYYTALFLLERAQHTSIGSCNEVGFQRESPLSFQRRIVVSCSSCKGQNKRVISYASFLIYLQLSAKTLKQRISPITFVVCVCVHFSENICQQGY